MRFLVVIFIFFNFDLHLISQTLISSNQQWVQYYSQIDINPKNRFGFDAGFRLKNEFTEPAQFIVRVSYLRKFRSDLFFGGGVANSGYFSSGAISTLEFRPYQELLYLNKWKKSSTQIRYRIEERFYIDYADSSVNQHRFVLRNRLAFSYTFFLTQLFKRYENTSLLFFVGEELFINFKTNNDVLWFDQNRIMLGPVLKFNQKLSMQFIYNFQFANTSVVNTFRLTHVYWLSFRHSLDFTKENVIE